MPSPPVALQQAQIHRAFNDERIDEYAWLSDRDDPQVLAHLRAENAHTEARMRELEPLQQELYRELISHIQETDTGPAIPHGPWLYYSRTVAGQEHPIFCRRPHAGGPEQVLLDVNLLAQGLEYCRVGEHEVSPDHRLLAYTVDSSGGERFELRIRDLASGADIDSVANVYYGIAWLDSENIAFTRPDAATMRPHQVWRHRLGSDAGTDVLIQQEDDARFSAELVRSRSGRFLLIGWNSNTTDEHWLLSTSDFGAGPRCVFPRRPGVEAQIADWGDELFILTNDGGMNFRLLRAPLDDPAPEAWREAVPHDPQLLREGMDLFAGFCVLYERGNAATGIRVLDLRRGEEHVVERPEEICHISPAENREWDTGTLHFEYSSPVTPLTTVAYDMRTRERRTVKVQPVPGYDPGTCVAERLWAPAPDGTDIPVTVVRPRDLALDGGAPCLLSGYGAYGISSDPRFAAGRLPLLERGFAVATAHVRGGSEMGRAWYLGGKMEAKTNSFTDFCACADALVAAGYTSHSRLAIRGGSAGGLLMGAVINLRPDLARVAVAHVPFVDVLTTMSDETLPLTVNEYEEWGNPKVEADYIRIKGYSPYDNVRALPYPALFVTGGLNDPRVSYWEPAKWVARLRRFSTSGEEILLKIQMGAGHGGLPGRYEAWREEAEVLAFVVDKLRVGTPA